MLGAMATGRGIWTVVLSLVMLGCGGREVPLVSSGDPHDLVRGLAHGVTVRELEVERPDTSMGVWIYRPPATLPGPLPVILIGSAGAPLIWGMRLGEGDRAEHVPWAEHGYIVVAYSLDGAVDDPESSRAIQAGIRVFLRAHAGLDDARRALKIALASESRADPARVYAVGHSSAATLALRVGIELPEIKAIVAFNPITDVEARVAEFRHELRAIDRAAMAILRNSSPMVHVAELRTKPVFLFHSTTDEVVPVAESTRLAEAMKPLAEGSRVVIVPTGDHYRSMLQQGIPAAIDWLDAAAGLRAPPTPK
jgi:dipeptidyl aminopeptidase/acylaminoacyl peptidase